MKQHFLQFLFLTIAFNALLAGETIIIQPGPAEGKDAILASCGPNNNYGSNQNIHLYSGAQGVQCYNRIIIEFDLASVPENAIIDSVFLSLYFNETSVYGDEHYGYNPFWIRRITSGWDEMTGTYATRPDYTEVNQVLVPQASSPTQDYPDIDVTGLVKDIINNPGNSHGFMFMLQDESEENMILLASSDHPDISNHPKLVIHYTPEPLPKDAGLTSFLYRNYCEVDSIYLIIENTGIDAIAEDIDFEYKVNDGAYDTLGAFTGGIFPGGSVALVFPVDSVTNGNIDLSVRIILDGDLNPENNELISEVFNSGIITDFPYSESFEQNAAGWFSSGTLNSWELGTPSAQVINCASNGYLAWVTNLTGNYNPNEMSYVQSPCFDFSGTTEPTISMDAWWESETGWDGASLQYSLNEGETWTTVGQYGDGTNWYNNNSVDALFYFTGNAQGWSGQSTSGSHGWLNARHVLSGLAGQTNVRLRVAFGSDEIINYEGFAFDMVRIYDRVSQDIEVSSVEIHDYCSQDTLLITLTNIGIDSVHDPVYIGYKVNEGAFDTLGVTDTLVPDQSLVISFPLSVNISGDVELTVLANYAADMTPSNNVLTHSVHALPLITDFPYIESFEDGPAGWTSGGTNNSWELGLPASFVINSASNGNAAWMTNLTGGYYSNEASYVQSPCFDFTSIDDPKIGLDVWWESETGYDGAAMQYSLDEGNTWNTIGQAGDGNNWYNDNNVDGLDFTGNYNGWSGAVGSGSNGWLNAKHGVEELAGEPAVRFRVVFGSDFIATSEGFAFDRFMVSHPYSQDIELSSFSFADNCGNDSVMLTITNIGTGTISEDIIIDYHENGVGYTVLGELSAPAPDESVDIVYPIGLVSAGNTELKIRAVLNTDMDTLNNELTDTIMNIPSITDFPYAESFESGNGGWVSGGINNSWELGIPSGTLINSASDGAISWVTNLNGVYNNNELSYVLSPCFNMTPVVNPIIKLEVWWETEGSFDGAALQYSTDGGNEWNGEVGDRNTWYNNGLIISGLQGITFDGQGWTGYGVNGSNGWLEFSQPISNAVAGANIRFRVVFGSDLSFTYEGIAFDNFRIEGTGYDDLEKLHGPMITNIYPLPANDVLFIDLGTSPSDALAIVYSTAGKEMYRQNLTDTHNALNIDGLNEGIYMLKIQDNSYSEVVKIVVAR